MKGNDAEMKKITVSLPSLCVKVRENCLLEQFPIACISAPKQASSRYFPPFTQRGNHSISLENLEFRIRASPQIIHLNILEIQFYLDFDKATPTSVSDNFFESREASIKHESKITLVLVS